MTGVAVSVTLLARRGASKVALRIVVTFSAMIFAMVAFTISVAIAI